MYTEFTIKLESGPVKGRRYDLSEVPPRRLFAMLSGYAHKHPYLIDVFYLVNEELHGVTYQDGKPVGPHVLADAQGRFLAREGLELDSTHAVALFHKLDADAPKEFPTQEKPDKVVRIFVQGTSWTLESGSLKKTGKVESQGSGHKNILSATWAALKTLNPKAKGYRYEIELSDSNVAKILRGEMQSKKYADAVSVVQEKLHTLNASIV